MSDTTQVLNVACNHCGASLSISGDTRFVTCAYCGSQLEIHRSGSAVYTEVMQAIDQRTQRIEQDVEQIKRQNEVEQLDRDWMLRREQFMVTNKNGVKSIPGTAGSIAGSVIGVVAGIVWMVFTGGKGAPAPFVLFGLVFIAVAIIGGITSASKASGYSEAEQEYQSQRRRLLESSREQEQS